MRSFREARWSRVLPIVLAGCTSVGDLPSSVSSGDDAALAEAGSTPDSLVCNAGLLRCDPSSKVVEMCTSAGTWASKIACDVRCSNGACVSDSASDGAAAGSGALPQGGGVAGTASSPAEAAGPAALDGGSPAQPDAATSLDAAAVSGNAGSAAGAVQCPAGACAPGGRCIAQAGDFVCECDSGFSGTGTHECTQIDDCTLNACRPGGTCVDALNGFTCECEAGYSGTGTRSCVNTDDCLGKSCGGSPNACVDGLNDWTCMCAAGFSGTGTKTCTNIDDCTSGACQPGGECVDLVNDYECKCSWPGERGSDPKQCPYRDNGDGSVFDSTTGLTWQTSEASGAPITEIGETTAANAARCAALSLGGRSWRLPTYDELDTMLEVLPATGCYAFQLDWRNAAYACLGASSTANRVRCVR